MERTAAEAMFKIIEGWQGWDECGFSSYYEFEDIKNKIINNEVLTFDEKQKAYNAVQSMRYYFNANVDNPRNPDGLRRDAQEFDMYYRLFIAEYYTKSFSEPKNKYSACYIATAVYGSYDAPQVMILRRFRDFYLQKRKWGREFVKLYYRLSPSFATMLKQNKGINNIVKCLLDAFVSVLKKQF